MMHTFREVSGLVQYKAITDLLPSRATFKTSLLVHQPQIVVPNDQKNEQKSSLFNWKPKFYLS